MTNAENPGLLGLHSADPGQPARSFWLAFLLLLAFGVSGQSYEADECDEVLVLLQVPNLPHTEVSSLICGQSIFLPVAEIFDFLKIKTEYSQSFNGYTGFIGSPDKAFEVNFDQQKITYEGREHHLDSSDFLSTRTETYLQAQQFGEIFDLDADFSFRNLSVRLTPGFELPIIREKRLAELRGGLKHHTQQFDPDTVVSREKALAHLSTANWGVNMTQQNNGLSSTRLQLALGGMLAGGEFRALLNYNSHLPLKERYQHYQWRHVNNSNPLLRQVRLGKIPVNSISTVYAPVLGAQVTNAPSYYRESFGTYHISERTQPGWTVELYVNNLLIDYTKADASGYFEFDVPLMYGSSQVQLRHYGPWGEEHSTTRLFKVPFAFLPEGELEYEASTGVVQDGTGSLLSQGRVSYGLHRQVTLGGGVEYLSTPGKLPQVMPFVNSVVSLAPGLMLNSQYVQGVRMQSLLSYYTPKLRLQASYKRYNEEQEAVRYNYDEERQAIVSMPYKLGNTRLFSRLALSHNKLGPSDFSTAELTLTGSQGRVNVSFSSSLLKRENQGIHGYSMLSASLPPIRGWALIPQVQYDYGHSGIRSARLEVRKQVLDNGFLQASLEKQFIPSSYLLQIGLRYDFNMARAGVSLSQGKHISSAHFTANGSLMHEPGANYTDFGRHTHVNLASVSFRPFLDLNNNGIRDSGEVSVEGLGVQINGGRKSYLNEDNAVVVTGLEAYRPYFVELNANDFPYLAWSIDHTRIELYLSANKMKVMDVPVKVMGEASGSVYLQEGGVKKGIGRTRVMFFDEDSVPVASQFTEGDGYFSYMGLPPGNYTARVSQEQLDRMEVTAEPPFVSFSIKSSVEGDFVDTLAFTLVPRPQKDGRPQLPATNQPVPLAGTDEPEVQETRNLQDSAEGEATEPEGIDGKPAQDGQAPAEGPAPVFKVQLVASANRIAPGSALFKGVDGVEEYKHGGLFKYIYGSERDLREILEVKNRMRNRGFSGAFVVAFINGVRVSIDEAINVQNARELPDFEEVVFKVQVLATGQSLPPSHELYRENARVDEYFHNGQYKYTLGHTSSLGEAVLMQYQLRQQGYEGAFVVAFRKGQRISLNKAIGRR